MALEVVGVEVDAPEVAAGVALGLVLEVWRVGIPAVASLSYRPGAQLRPELHGRHEGVAAGGVEALRSRPATPGVRGERAPSTGGERHRGARLGVVERLDDRAVIALEAVDLAPRHLPAAEVLGQLSHRRVERSESLLIGRARPGGPEHGQ